jgi:uncharacterized repeat protein (TIGR01451 family)
MFRLAQKQRVHRQTAATCATRSIGARRPVRLLTIKWIRRGRPVTITSPVANATYQQNALATADYACTDGRVWCVACQGLRPSGGAIDTSSTGAKTFTGNASDIVGNLSSASRTYSVVTGGGGVRYPPISAYAIRPYENRTGGTLTYSIAVKNASKTTAAGAVVSDTLPAGTVFASASTSQGTITAPAVGSNGTVTVNLGTSQATRRRTSA